jgi:REP element-mobilizing transposase RayT
MAAQKVVNRKSVRWRGHEYEKPGYYFITICTANRIHSLGSFQDDVFVPSPLGIIVQDAWNQIPSHFTNASTDAFVMMPDHIHGIIVIQKPMVKNVDFTNNSIPHSHDTVGAQHVAPLRSVDNHPTTDFDGPVSHRHDTVGAQHVAPPRSVDIHRDFSIKFRVIPGSLGSIIRAFKAACTRNYRSRKGSQIAIWQRNYHDRVIRDNDELERVRIYIAENPYRWLQRQQGSSNGSLPARSL